MARSFLCIKCNVEFPTDAIYMAHKKGDHKTYLDQSTPLESLPVPTPPPGVPLEGAEMPSKEFIEIVKRIEGEKEESTPTETSRPSQHPTELPKADPIKLEYIYRGVCPEDRAQITTLELDVAEKHFCIAICSVCKKQLETKEVEKI